MKLLGIISMGFGKRSTTDEVFCICQILEEKLEYNETRLLDFKKTCE
jgi:hypothetical protein